MHLIQLARRLFYSFARPGAEFLIVEDIARFFSTPDEADAAFAIFDKDSNGDVNRDELEMACLEFHREQLSIENSMRDLDSAVGRLDNILMSVYFIVAILIIAVALVSEWLICMSLWILLIVCGFVGSATCYFDHWRRHAHPRYVAHLYPLKAQIKDSAIK